VSGVAIIELFSFRREKHTFEKMGLEYIINDILFHMRKKKYLELKQVSEFMSEQSGEIRAEYFLIVDKLEIEGRLEMPFAEKVEDSLFAIRIISTGNIRIFYTYGEDDRIYGIRAYVKKTRNIPAKEMEQARKVLKIMRRENML
jgi:phage-related protein